MATTITNVPNAPAGAGLAVTLPAAGVITNVGGCTIEVSAFGGRMRLEEGRSARVPTPAPTGVIVRGLDDPAGGALRTDAPVTSSAEPMLAF